MCVETLEKSDIKDDPLCFLCGTPSENKCSYCNLIYYCGDHHFRLHRPEELILYDTTQAFGPKNSNLVCIECLKSDPKGFCKSCCWPICDEKSKCQGKHLLHSLRECEILQNCKNKEILEDSSNLVDYTCAIAPLRLLLLKDTNPEEFERFQYLMDHNEERRKDVGVWNGYKKYITDFLRIDCNLSDNFTEEEIERVSGIFWTNAFACSNGGGQAVFPTFSFISHSCTSNCDHTVFPQRHLVLQSKIHIAAGTELNINYVSPIQGRLKRRPKLECKWFFDCICNRCLDATEFGSHLSSHLCESCGDILLPKDPLIIDSNYLCPSGHSKSSEEILSFEHKVTLEMQENIPKKNIENFYALLNKYSSKLHATHYLMLLLKRHIIALYGDSLEQEDLEKKIDLCEEVLNGICKMDPGYNRDRGMILQYLCDAQKKLNRLLMGLGQISEEEFKSRVEVCMKNFNVANECLTMKIKKT